MQTIGFASECITFWGARCIAMHHFASECITLMHHASPPKTHESVVQQTISALLEPLMQRDAGRCITALALADKKKPGLGPGCELLKRT